MKQDKRPSFFEYIKYQYSKGRAQNDYLRTKDGLLLYEQNGAKKHALYELVSTYIALLAVLCFLIISYFTITGENLVIVDFKYIIILLAVAAAIKIVAAFLFNLRVYNSTFEVMELNKNGISKEYEEHCSACQKSRPDRWDFFVHKPIKAEETIKCEKCGQTYTQKNSFMAMDFVMMALGAVIFIATLIAAVIFFQRQACGLNADDISALAKTEFSDLLVTDFKTDMLKYIMVLGVMSVIFVFMDGYKLVKYKYLKFTKTDS